MMTHRCVDAAVRASADFGFQVLVAADACATRALTYGATTVPAAQVHAALLAAFKSYGTVMSTEEILSKLGAEKAQEQK
jgi:nicotinamidase-related amidase